MQSHRKTCPLPVGASIVFMTSLSTSFLASGLTSSSFPPSLPLPTVCMHTIQCISLWREKLNSSGLNLSRISKFLGWVMAEGEELQKPTPVLESHKGVSVHHSTWAKKYCCIAGSFSGGLGLHWGCYSQIWVHHLDVGAWAGASSRLSLLYFNTQNRHIPTCQAGSPVTPLSFPAPVSAWLCFPWRKMMRIIQMRLFWTHQCFVQWS